MNLSTFILRNLYFRITSVVVLTLLVGTAIAQIAGKRGDDANVELKIALRSAKDGNVNELPTEITFRNRSDESLRILDLFNGSISSKVFFSATWSDVEGTPVFTMGGGKISPSKDVLTYVELGPNKEFSTEINLRDFLPVKQPLKPGIYLVQITYRNQYGENCFHGRVQSNKINVVLND